jgi:L-threonylcarbamoyladenylate synthase
VRDEFPELVAAGMPILEGGSSEVGIESTIIDLSRLSQGIGPVLLRPGLITANQISQILETPVHQPDAQAPRVSGALKSHYAPQTPIKLASGTRIASDALSLVQRSSQKIVCVTHSIAQATQPQHAQIEWIAMPPQPAAYGYALYASLRALDQARYDCMLWEDVPDTPEWSGIRDRLGRAAAAF